MSLTASEFLQQRAEIAEFLKQGRFKRPADAQFAAEALISRISDGVPLPVKPEQTELPLAAATVADESDESEDDDE